MMRIAEGFKCGKMIAIWQIDTLDRLPFVSQSTRKLVPLAQIFRPFEPTDCKKVRRQAQTGSTRLTHQPDR